MNAKAQRPPPNESWFWMTLEFNESHAWRSAGINARRLIDFLLREHMRHGGAENGKLKAPYEQLQAYGIGPQYIMATIAEVGMLGLVDAARHGMKVATTYTLTWLPNHDGTPATNRWRTFRNPALRSLPAPKPRNLPNKGKVDLPNKGKADGLNLPNKGKADDPQNLPNKGKDLSRNSYRDRSYNTGVSSREPPQLNGAGLHPAGKPSRLQRKQEELLRRTAARGAA